MARIRTLKPDHRLHRKVGPLSHLGYRLWVGMILEADDDGRLICSAEQLRAQVVGYHASVTAAHVETEIQAIAAAGLIRLYAVDSVRYAWFQSWHDHQRIDKKQASKLPCYDDSKNVLGTLWERSRLKGREGKGVEGNGKEGNGILPSPAVAVAPVTRLAWDGYSAAYLRRYGVQPIRNAKVNGQLAQVVKRIGAAEAGDVAAFYVGHNGALYVRAGHAVDLLLRDAEKLRTEWVTGRKITDTGARQADETAERGGIAQRLLAKAARQRQEAQDAHA